MQILVRSFLNIDIYYLFIRKLEIMNNIVSRDSIKIILKKMPRKYRIDSYQRKINSIEVVVQTVISQVDSISVQSI